MNAKVKNFIRGGKKSPMPDRVSPMLCTLLRAPVIKENYVHEIKLDGYRIVAFCNKTKVRLDSRSSLNYSSKFPTIVRALKNLKLQAVLDGEVCALDNEGRPNFDLLQKPPLGTKIVYYAFDILWINGFLLTELPLLQRKEILKTVLENHQEIRFTEHFDDASVLFRQTVEMGLEGIVSKKKDSNYIEGYRGENWYKTPAEIQQEFVIGGWVESGKGRPFATLLFGAYKGNDLYWVGHAGGGFKDKEMMEISRKLRSIRITKKPFVNDVDYSGTAHWVKPVLVANFKFATYTKSGRIRKPAIFKGFRTDKNPKDVFMEFPEYPPISSGSSDNSPLLSPSSKQTPRKNANRKYLNEDSNWKKVDAKQKNAHWTTFNMKECMVPVHDLDREIWKGVTKGQLMLYYSQAAKWILPYIKDRPESLVLKLTNAGASKIFIKDMENRQPECAEVFRDTRRIDKPGKRDIIDYLVCNNLETLIYMVDLGCIDINPWASRTQSIVSPDFIWLDLDPTIDDKLKGEKLIKAEADGFNKTIKVAQATKKILDGYNLRAFIKTSGKTGLHIYIPCSRYTFEQTRMLASTLAEHIRDAVPKISTTHFSIDNREDKIYIDTGQNDYGDTLAAPYCVRPFHQPLISTPINWAELNTKLSPYNFSIHNIADRLHKKGDLFGGLMDKRTQRSNVKSLEKLLSV